jgi:hypothetical protein
MLDENESGNDYGRPLTIRRCIRNTWGITMNQQQTASGCNDGRTGTTVLMTDVKRVRRSAGSDIFDNVGSCAISQQVKLHDMGVVFGKFQWCLFLNS